MGDNDVRGTTGVPRPGRLRHADGRRRGDRSEILHISTSIAALGCFLFALPAPAVEIIEGEFQGSLDTTLSHGMTFRIAEREDRVYDYRSANSNDGNLNYDRGLVSNTTKFTTDLDLNYRHLGAFVRATGFVDFENRDGIGERSDLPPATKDLAGDDFEILDAYVTGTFTPGGTPVDVRLGRHVLNWGESTFITNGINAFNRFDVAKLRLPGAELREALAPNTMVSVSVAPTYNLSVEGFYQLDWEETVIDPVGSYFSSTDYAGPGRGRRSSSRTTSRTCWENSEATSTETAATRPDTSRSDHSRRPSMQISCRWEVRRNSTEIS